MFFRTPKSRRTIAACLLCLATLLTGVSRDAEPAHEARMAVQTGIRLEQSRQWQDAIEHYRKSLADWPENEYLKYGLRRSQIHFGIDRRYLDKSFRKSLMRLSDAEAMALLEDVLDRLRTHFVDAISTKSVVAHGTESLWLALSNSNFLEENVLDVSPERVEEMRRILREEYWNKDVAGRDGARQLVGEVADRGQQTLGLSRTAVILEYVFGGCNCLDDYSNVLTPGRLDDLYNNIEGEFVGIGIVMEAETGKGLKLVNVLPESPAKESGLKRNEHIVAIDGTDCRFMTTDEAAGLLTGRGGSTVSLEVRDSRSESSRTVHCTRRAVNVRSISVAKIVDSERGIGYIRMDGFQKSSAVELDAALAKLDREGMRSLIWDVRGNPGGLLMAAVEVLDRFLEEGSIVSTRGRMADQNFHYTANRPGTWNLPLVLLIDGNSASASEIVAGAVRDHKRGTIVGRTSFGKWSVQSIYPARYATGLRLTTAKFYSPAGLNHSDVGVDPDISVMLPEDFELIPGVDEADPTTDPDIAKAVEVLRGQPAYTLR